MKVVGKRDASHIFIKSTASRTCNVGEQVNVGVHNLGNPRS